MNLSDNMVNAEFRMSWLKCSMTEIPAVPMYFMSI